MSRYRGSKGRFAVGGVIVGTPLVQGAVAQGAGAATFDATSLTGVVQPGDTFTVAGDPQTYTIVTGGVIASNEVAVTFTPTVQVVGGWADNALVTPAVNSMGHVKEWEATLARPWMDGTCMGDEAQTGDLDIPMSEGRAMVLLDYADTKQAAVVDQARENADSAALALALVVATGKFLYVDALMSSIRVRSERGNYVEAEVQWRGQGVAALGWA